MFDENDFQAGNVVRISTSLEFGYYGDCIRARVHRVHQDYIVLTLTYSRLCIPYEYIVAVGMD